MTKQKPEWLQWIVTIFGFAILAWAACVAMPIGKQCAVYQTYSDLK